ncbi:MAG TPA: hypothetical protein DCE71_06865 [Parachlamydiales bacterium]|nr:hypothetical protein [Parachlamydiales bacterium]
MGCVRLYLSKIDKCFSSSYWLRGLAALLILSVVFRAPLLMKHLSKGFHMARFELDYDWSDIEDPFADEKEALKIFSQPFTYLGRGAQCYVFESCDQNYVVKIFQENRRATPLSRWKGSLKRKKNTDFRSCLVAYSLAREETALEYLHLHTTKARLPKLSVQSPTGQWFSLPLDRYSFALQKKAKPFQETLIQASLEGNLAVYLSSFLSLIDSRLAKGIRNEDKSLLSNFGFLDQKAVEIDFGRYLQSEVFLQPDMQRMEKKMFVDQLSIFLERELPHEIKTLETCLLQSEQSLS